MPRVRLRIWWLMAAAAVVAFLMSLPAGAIIASSIFVIPAILILLPVAVAPSGRRFEVLYWAMALHPAMLLGWVAFWRFLVIRRSLGPTDHGWFLMVTLDAPYAMLFFSGIYMPIPITFAFFWAVLSRFESRPLVKPHVVLSLAWLTIWIVLSGDLFRINDWFFD
jgi:hypothetical protein